MSFLKLKLFIEKGIDEFFSDYLENNYFGLSTSEFNILFQTACESNEFEMVKKIYEKIIEIENLPVNNKIDYDNIGNLINLLDVTTWTIEFDKKVILEKDTLEICLRASVINCNYEMFDWLLKIGADISESHFKNYFKSAVESRNFMIIKRIYWSKPELYSSLIKSALKHCVLKGYYELFNQIMTLEYVPSDKWFFDYYCKSISDINFFVTIFDYNKPFMTTDVFYDLIANNKLAECKLVYYNKRYDTNTMKRFLSKYFYERSKNVEIYYWLLTCCVDTDYIYEYTYKFIIERCNRYENIDVALVLLHKLSKEKYVLKKLLDELCIQFLKIKNEFIKNNIEQVIILIIDYGIDINMDLIVLHDMERDELNQIDQKEKLISISPRKKNEIFI